MSKGQCCPKNNTLKIVLALVSLGTAMELDEETEGARLEMPSVDLVKAAMGTEPNLATTEMKAAMDVLLNMAMPAVVPQVLKQNCWVSGETTHLSLFTSGQWSSEMASALFLIDNFSEVEQIYFNIGFRDEFGDNIPKEDRREKGAEKKKRKKVIRNTNVGALEEKHAELQMFALDLIATNEGKKKLNDWDHHCCKRRGKKRLGDLEDGRVCTIPRTHEREAGPSYLELVRTRCSDQLGLDIGHVVAAQTNKFK